jgi:mono/diheme cytochrome c family protein
MLKQRDELAWTDSRARWGRGRVEPFNPPKFGILKLPIDQTIGVTDIMPLWNMTSTEGSSYHWDGLSTDLGEVERSSALGDGATLNSIALDNLERIKRWIVHRPPPPYPLPIDPARAAEGKRIFEATGCASCHAPSGKRFRSVIPVDEPGLGTDRHRLDMWTMQAKDAYTKYADGTSWPFRHFQKTNGYVALPLDGLWLRAPYLHNGSVPTLYHLLNPDQRVPRFFRGSDVIDAKLVGFTFEPPDDKAKAASFLARTTELDTTLPGNGNQGHTYGAELGPDDKAALLEYLKTL